MNTSSLWNLRILFSIQHNREFDTIRRPVNEESCKHQTCDWRLYRCYNALRETYPIDPLF